MDTTAKTEDFYAFKFWYVFFAYTVMYILLTFLANRYVYTSDFYYSLFQNTLDSERIDQLIQRNQRFQWVSYIVQPLFLLLRCAIFASVIFAGLLLSKANVSFGSCLRIVIIADGVALIVTLIRTVWFIFRPTSSPLDFQSFYPLSAIQLLDIHKIPRYLIYPLQQINLFEVCYWVLLAFGIRSLTNRKWDQSFSIVAATYGVSMLIWMLIVVFITLQFS
ncbi:MAG TPA: hypothetical protein VG605_09335 [Puia sp.]|jgi:hypothetical protein|nr:hypothetical protein [Puia sp.]